MAEMLEVYDLSGKFLFLQDRKEFYAQTYIEFIETGKITRQVRVVRFLLMTSEGRIYIQKRSLSKSDNAGLYDKTVGGHIKANYPDDMAATMECQEELAIPMYVLSSREFETIRGDVDLRVTGIMQKLARVVGEISERRQKDGYVILQPLIVTYYIGYYNGSIRFKDGESTGVETFSFEELNQLLILQPEKFTSDLKHMITKFAKNLVPFDQFKFDPSAGLEDQFINREISIQENEFSERKKIFYTLQPGMLIRFCSFKEHWRYFVLISKYGKKSWMAVELTGYQFDLTSRDIITVMQKRKSQAVIEKQIYFAFMRNLEILI